MQREFVTDRRDKRRRNIATDMASQVLGTDNNKENYSIPGDHAVEVKMVDMYPSIKANVSVNNGSSAVKRADSKSATTSGSKLKLAAPVRVPLKENNDNFCNDPPTSPDEDTDMLSSEYDRGDDHHLDRQQKKGNEQKQQVLANSGSQPLRRWQLSDFDIGKPLGKLS